MFSVCYLKYVSIQYAFVAVSIFANKCKSSEFEWTVVTVKKRNFLSSDFKGKVVLGRAVVYAAQLILIEIRKRSSAWCRHTKDVSQKFFFKFCVISENSSPIVCLSKNTYIYIYIYIYTKAFNYMFFPKDARIKRSTTRVCDPLFLLRTMLNVLPALRRSDPCTAFYVSCAVERRDVVLEDRRVVVGCLYQWASRGIKGNVWFLAELEKISPIRI